MNCTIRSNLVSQLVRVPLSSLRPQVLRRPVTTRTNVCTEQQRAPERAMGRCAKATQAVSEGVELEACDPGRNRPLETSPGECMEVRGAAEGHRGPKSDMSEPEVVTDVGPPAYSDAEEPPMHASDTGQAKALQTNPGGNEAALERHKGVESGVIEHEEASSVGLLVESSLTADGNVTVESMIREGSRISAALTMKKLLGDMSGVAPVATKRTDLTLPVDSAASKGMAKTDSPKSKSLAKAPFRPPTPFEELSAQFTTSFREGRDMVVLTLPGHRINFDGLSEIARSVLQDLKADTAAADSGEKKAKKLKSRHLHGMLTSRSGISKLQALRNQTSFGPRAVFLVRDHGLVEPVVTRFNNACRTVFQALAVYTPHDLKISTTTAVIVTTPSVFRSLDYATLTRRIKTIVLDHVHPNFLPDILSLPPLYDPKSSEEEPARQIVAFLDYQQEARTIMRHYGKAGMPSPSVLHFPFFASKYLKGAASLKHSFLQAETEKAALVALVQEMRVLRPDNFKPVGILAPATVPRVLVVLSGAMAGKDAQHVVAVLKRPRLAIPSLKKTWFKETTVGDILTSKKNTGDIFKEYDHKNLHVLVTSESLIHDIRYKQVDAVVFFGMPHPRNYFCACRLFLQESKIASVRTIHDESHASLVTVVKRLLASDEADPKKLALHCALLQGLMEKKDRISFRAGMMLEDLDAALADLEKLELLIEARPIQSAPEEVPLECG